LQAGAFDPPDSNQDSFVPPTKLIARSNSTLPLNVDCFISLRFIRNDGKLDIVRESWYNFPLL